MMDGVLSFERKWLPSCGGVAMVVADVRSKAYIRTLNLRQCGLDAQGAAELGKFLGSNATLTALQVGGESKFGDEGVRGLLMMMKDNTCLKELSMEDVMMTSEGAACVADMLRANQTLQTLSVSFNLFGDAGATALVEASIAGRTLTSLSMNASCMTHECVPRIIEALKQNKSLLSLYIAGNNFLSGDALAFADLLRIDAVLKDFFVGDFLVNDGAVMLLAEALRHNPSMRRFGFPHVDKNKTKRKCAKWLEVNGGLTECYGMQLREICQRNGKMHAAAKAAALEVLKIRWLRQSVLDVLPKDVVRLIAMQVLKSKTLVHVWSKETKKK